MRIAVAVGKDCIEILDADDGSVIVQLDHRNAEEMARFVLEECERKKRERLN